jgi:hypothetical protein
MDSSPPPKYIISLAWTETSNLLTKTNPYLLKGVQRGVRESAAGLQAKHRGVQVSDQALVLKPL